MISELAILQGKVGYLEMKRYFKVLTVVYNSGKKQQTTNWRAPDLTNVALYSVPVQA